MVSKLEIQWSPIQDKFVTWGPEITLYQIQSENEAGGIRLSSKTSAKILATNTNHHYVKCLDIYPKSEKDLLLAVGLSNGRISLTTFGPTEYDTLGLTGKELVPRHPRQCNAVCWNNLETNLIAGGLDKYRNDNSVLIWDITKNSQNNDVNNAAGRLSVNTMAPAVELAKPVAEYGVSEIAHSMAWFNGTSKVLAAGMNQKNIKLFDIRDSSKVVNSTLTKAVYGVCMDPNDDKQLASFHENFVYVWDTRNFEKPVLMLTHPKPLMKIAWCPTKFNLLSTLQKESSVINLYDIQHTVIGNEEVEPSVLERVVVPGSPHNIMSFSWHGTDENKFLSIALSGSITEYTVFDRITLNWGASSNIMWSHGRKVLKYIDDESLDDISSKIKQRAINGYGLTDELWKNGELVDNEMLTNVWNWLYLSGKLVEDGDLSGNQWRHPGVQSVLKIDVNNSKSENYTIHWSDLGNNNCHGVVKLYKHDDRDKALHLCSWPFDRDSTRLQKFLEQLEREQAYTRAAAIAVFNLKIRLAIEILSRAPDSGTSDLSLNVVGMALAGFSDDKNSTWKHFCSSTKHKFNDPYLKVIFSFLTAENYNYDSVLNENGIAVDDRVAFACLFLPDNRLYEYLKKLSEKLIDEGNLDGLLITGNNHDGMKLLQKYLDGTGDIQSTALIAARAFPVEIFSDCIREWVECYRNLLDTWQLWNERANFDIMLHSHWPNEKAPDQVYVSCSFCGKSISAYMHGLTRGRGPYTRMGGTANKIKMSSCPNCRKPLPRCAICLMHMGTTIANFSEDIDMSKTMEFINWFTWCQTCRHGGHAGHISNWEHSECPVTGCNCKCASADLGV